MSLTERSDAHPRFVKIVRTGIARFLGSSEVEYREADPKDLVPGLRAKLIEEAVEYLQDPSVGELADVLEVVKALAIHDLGLSWWQVEDEAEAKANERGNFHAGYGMYVRHLNSAAAPRRETCSMNPDLSKRVALVIREELRGTIPPSIDPMRAVRFERAAAASVGVLRSHLVDGATVERAAQAAFYTDRKLGHHKDDWTWDDIPPRGREDYRRMISAALLAALGEEPA